MGTKINYYWRVVATGSAFAGFGVGGLILTALFFPVVRLWPGTKEQKTNRIQRIIHRGYNIFLGYLQLLGVCKVEIKGREQLLQGGQLVIANHPSLLDIVLLIAAIPQADCIVKASAWHNPFFHGVLSAAGYIKNDDPIELVETCVQRLKAGRTLIIFPEGTRSKRDKLCKFKRGASMIALQSGAPLVPVTIECEPSTLTKSDKWYNVPERPFHLSMEVGDALDVDTVTRDSRNHRIAARTLTQHMEQHFLATGPYNGIA
jgi:1-acyl-sn-glycerol-3-phosphate acyltransferase